VARLSSKAPLLIRADLIAKLAPTGPKLRVAQRLLVLLFRSSLLPDTSKIYEGVTSKQSDP